MSTDSVPAEDRFVRGLIVGSAGGMGAMLLERLGRHGHRVAGLDKVAADAEIVEDIEQASPRTLELLAGADLVVLALPDDVAIRVAPAIARALPPDALLVDCSSVKARLVRGVEDVGCCELISINPLFGPGLDPAGRAVAVTPLRPGPAALRFERFLEKAGMRPVKLDPATHDRAMAEAQAGVHALLLAHLLSRSARPTDLAPPPAAALDRLTARMLTGASHVYWSIQVDNPWAGEARKRLIAALQALDEQFLAGDREGFEARIDTARGVLSAPVATLARDCVRMFEAMTTIGEDGE